jgi:predicted ABC-type exoprotein transport system permease subunit
LNFVIATYQLFLLRNPTEFEKTEGVKIVDGFTGVLFLQEANSKDQYLDIFLNSTDYAEGQVKQMFNRFLFRSPNTEESVFYTQILKQNLDFKNLLVNILKTNEYAGID